MMPKRVALGQGPQYSPNMYNYWTHVYVLSEDWFLVLAFAGYTV